MKRKFLFVSLLAVMVSMFIMTSVYAAAPAMTAKANTATIDGIVTAGEYGPAFTVNNANVKRFAEQTKDLPALKYYFAYDATALYWAITAEVELTTIFALQINVNPGGLLADADYGEFITIFTDANGVTGINQHNVGTKLKANDGENVPITDKVTYKLSNDKKTVEVKLPIDVFKITTKNTNDNTHADHKKDVAATFNNLELKPGTTMKVSPFIVLIDNGKANGYGAVDGALDGKFTLGLIKTGTLTLEPVQNANTADVFSLAALVIPALAGILLKKKR